LLVADWKNTLLIAGCLLLIGKTKNNKQQTTIEMNQAILPILQI
jgi:hypothetical protein